MTVRLSPTSPRRLAAERFATELRKAMAARKASAKRLGAASGCSHAAINNWRSAGNLPRVDTAAKLAEVLDWPKLVELARAGRTLRCKTCDRTFVNQGGGYAWYCTTACREIHEQLRRPSSGAALAAEIRDELARREGQKGAIPKEFLAGALERYAKADARRVARVDKQADAIASLRTAIDEMCRGCEPEGLCRSAGCPLRVASPLPLELVGAARHELRPATGAWGPEHAEKARTAVLASNARRWNAPGARTAASEQMRSWWANRTPEERAAHAEKISAGRRVAS